MKTMFIYLLFLFIIINAQNKIEGKFKQSGLVDIKSMDSSIEVDLVNSSKRKNFFRQDFYNGLSTAYLRREVAVKLAKAQKILKNKDSSYSLLILDAARPRSVSQKMYDHVKGTKFEKFVAKPNKGSMHNYGIAVDITITKNGKEIDMGYSPFRKSTPTLYWQFLMKKLGRKVSKKQNDNRELLSSIMQQAGFIPLSFEWWHFNGMAKDKARKKYKIIE